MQIYLSLSWLGQVSSRLLYNISIFFQFLGWLDRDPNAQENFLRISTNSSSIVLTGSHLIFRSSVAEGAPESIYADQIEKGDKLIRWNGLEMTKEEVVAVEVTSERGFWTPLTREGTLLVDGLLASSYASFPHTLSDLALTPVKMFPRLLLDDEESQHKDGLREVIKNLKSFGTIMGSRQRNHREKEIKRKGFVSNNGGLPAATVGVSKHMDL